jgi:hypothetical protein
MSDTPTTNWCTLNPSKAVSGVGFQPDLVWIKNRSRAGSSHVLVDAVRGATKALSSNLSNAEVTTNGTDDFRSFDSDGFTVGDSSNYFVNSIGDTHVAWCFKAGGTAVSNTDGTLTSSVSANQDAGFSIVSYTGNNTDGATIGHGLGEKPSVIIVKERNGGSGWFVYHKSLGATKYLTLNAPLNTANLPAPDIADGSEYFDTVTYTGNGTSQSISSLDFSPDLVWLKCRSIAYNHRLVDSVQGVGSTLSSNLTNAAVNSSSEFTSLDSNGFSITQGAGYEFNNNAVPYVAWAWDAGGTGSSNTDGSITSTVSANPTAGFIFPPIQTGLSAIPLDPHTTKFNPAFIQTFQIPRSTISPWTFSLMGSK